MEAGLARAAYKKMAAGKDKDRLGKSIDLYGKAGDKNGVNVKFDPNVYGGTLLEEDGSLTVTLYSEFTVVGQSYDGAVTRDVQAGVLAHE